MNANATDALTAVIQIIDTAVHGWTGCDWTHEADSFDGIDNYCDGGNEHSCDTCREARENARDAMQLGRDAISALSNGDAPAALALCEAAAKVESQYGDDPTWAPAVKAVQALIDDALAEDHTHA